MTIPSFQEIPLPQAAELAARVAGIPARSHSELMRHMELQPGWMSLDGWPEIEDADLLRQLVGQPKYLGELHVVSDRSYAEGRGAFIVQAGRLNAFVHEYVEHFGEAFFNGDVIVVSCEQKAVWIFHHEGLLLRWRAKPSSSRIES
jgi:hypothetical protein